MLSDRAVLPMIWAGDRWLPAKSAVAPGAAGKPGQLSHGRPAWHGI
jgi:hypothetical protein